jgi:hypothetical protein
METDAERFLFVSPEMAATPEHIVSLLESPRLTPDDVVCGCHLTEEGFLDATPLHPRQLTRGAGVRFAELIVSGTGFTAVHRETMRRLEAVTVSVRDKEGSEWRPYFMPLLLEYVSGDDGLSREYLADDHALVWRLRGVGASIWLDTEVRVGRVRDSVVVPVGAIPLHPRIAGPSTTFSNPCTPDALPRSGLPSSHAASGASQVDD